MKKLSYFAIFEEKEDQETKQEDELMDTQEEEDIIRKIPTGMKNTGNSCFFNAVVQGLSNIDLLFKEKNINESRIITKEMYELCQTLISGENKTVTPYKLQGSIKQAFPRFDNREQQDAHELLMVIVNSMIEEEKLNEMDKKVEKENLEHLLYGTMVKKVEMQ